METFIRELEEERIRELAAYLTASGLTDYHLTPPEIDIIYQFDKNSLGYLQFGETIWKIDTRQALEKCRPRPGKIDFCNSRRSKRRHLRTYWQPRRDIPQEYNHNRYVWLC